MIQKAKKKSLFLMGILLTSLFGVVLSHTRSSYSKDDSLLLSCVATKASADVATFTSAGDGCGGCSAGDSGSDGGAGGGGGGGY